MPDAPRARVGVLISGRGSNMAALLYASRAEDCPFELVLVASDKPEAPGLALAEAEGVATFAAPDAKTKRPEWEAALQARLAAADVEVIALAGYMRLLSPAFVEAHAGRIVNIHPSLLPRYKGLDTHARALKAGDRIAGCSVHLVTAEVDAGEVLAQTAVAILPGDTPDTLAARVLVAEHQLYPRTLARFVARGRAPDDLLGRLRELALALPEAEERMSHGAPAFFVRGGKAFAYFSCDHHGSGVTAVLIRTSGAEEQAMLIEQNDELYYRPPYFGPSGWIGLRLDRGPPDWDHVGDWLGKSWQLAAPKRLAALPL